MNISEKIITSRKKMGMSQIDLADALGVSRQSISKWETGESKPDISKLPEIAKVLNISIDWLLSDDNVNSDNTVNVDNIAGNNQSTPNSTYLINNYPNWINRLPNTLGNMFKKYGWIYGVYMAISGVLFIIMGAVIIFTSYMLTHPDSNTVNYAYLSDADLSDADLSDADLSDADASISEFLSSNDLNDSFDTYLSFGDNSFDDINSQAFSIFCVIGGFTIFIGLLLSTAGTILAYKLKQWGKQTLNA